MLKVDCDLGGQAKVKLGLGGLNVKEGRGGDHGWQNKAVDWCAWQEAGLSRGLHRKGSEVVSVFVPSEKRCPIWSESLSGTSGRYLVQTKSRSARYLDRKVESLEEQVQTPDNAPCPKGECSAKPGCKWENIIVSPGHNKIWEFRNMKVVREG